MLLQQALHIFKKDFRHLRYEIAGMLLAVILFIVADAGNNQNGLSEILQVFLPVAWCYLIARAVHAEPIPGDRQFWITRPYRRGSVLLAKAIFILVVVNLPLLIAQAAILAIDGFALRSSLGALLWEQVVVTALVTLPALAFAAMTANMIQFVAGIGLLGALGVAALTGLRDFGAARWIAYSILAAVTLAAGISILWLQYRLRKTFVSMAVEISAVLLGVGLVMLTPPGSAFAIQSRLSGTLPASLRVELKPTPSIASRGIYAPAGTSYISLPFRVMGLANDDVLRCEGVQFAIQSPSGAAWKGRTPFNSPFNQTADGCEAKLPIDGVFLGHHRDEGVHIYGTLSLTIFGNSRSTALLADAPTMVPGVGRCQQGPVEQPRPKETEVREFLCRAALRWPGLLVTGHAPDRVTGQTFRTNLSYSPFPAEFTISPVDSRLGLVAGDAITVTTQEPLAHVQAEFDGKDIRLGNLEVVTAH